MDIYKILRRVTSVRSGRLRLMMLLCAHLSGRRAIGVYMDPVVACNLRCRMCAFSAPERRKKLHGRMTDEELENVARGLFGRALKVQIGCGAEPTLDSRVADIISMAKKRGVPYVAITTNGQLLTPGLLAEYAQAGLDEVTLSMHGTTKKTYEWLMDGASYKALADALDAVRQTKLRYPRLKLRINYTVNADNVRELRNLPDVVGEGLVDIIQIRPVQRLGDTSYNNFDLSAVVSDYGVIRSLSERCRDLGVECLIPGISELESVSNPRTSQEALFESVTYCYAGPGMCYSSDYDLSNDDYRKYHRRMRTAWRIMAGIVSMKSSGRIANNTTKKLNYRVRK